MHIFTSVDEVAEEARNAGFDLDYVQLEQGDYAGTFPTRAHNRSVFIDETHTVGVAVNGTMFEDTCMVVRGTDQLTFNGRSVGRNELFVYMPGAELHMTARGAIRAPQLCMPAAVVESYLNAADPDGTNRQRPAHIRIQATPEVCNWFDSSVRLLTKADEPDDGLAQNVEHHILSYLTKIDDQSLEEEDTRGRGRPIAYYERTFGLILNYIHANLRARIALDELCAATGVSLRTLQRVFTKRTGMSPRKYILTCKLNAVRSELLDGSAHEQTVMEIAKSYGITHMGRFSAAYFALFNEYPRETLSRNS